MGLRLGVVAVWLLGIFASSGQATVVYTDSWESDSMVPTGAIYEQGDVRAGPYIFGCGVTEGYYDASGHYEAVSTTLYSPRGRAALGSADSQYTGVGYARADVSLIWEPEDFGDYVAISDHMEYCPYRGDSSFTSGPIFILVGGSNNSMRQIAPGSFAFRAISPCDVTCRLDGYLARTSAFRCANVFIPYVNGVCLSGSIVAFQNEPCGPCGEVSHLFNF